MAKDIFDIIVEKNYHQLTSDELAEIADFCKNEEEFLAMKQVLSHTKSIADGPKLSPREATKEKLDNLFDSTYGKSRKFIPFYLNPIIRIAAVLAVGFAVWMFSIKSDIGETTQLAENTVPKQAEKIEATTTKEVMNTKTEEDADKTQKKIKITENPPKAVKAAYNEPSILPHSTYSMEISEPFSDAPAPTSIKMKANTGMDSEISDHKTNNDSKKSFATVSAPAASVKDISVDSSKSPYKNQTVVYMNVTSQRNVMNYLVARY